MILWCAIVALTLMVSLLCIWNILLYGKQRDMQFETDKLKMWKQRVEVATSTLNTDLLEIMDTDRREKWNYARAFDKITEAIERWAERFAGLRGEKE